VTNYALKWAHRVMALKRLTAAVIAATACSSTLANAETWSVGQMLSYCGPVEAAQIESDYSKSLPNTYYAGVCAAYFTALLHAASVVSGNVSGLHYCPPQGANAWQMIAVYLRAFASGTASYRCVSCSTRSFHPGVPV
jgi:hypothetical protein